MERKRKEKSPNDPGSKKRKDGEEDDEIFSLIALPIWGSIFQFLTKEKKTLSDLRLVCKNFRNLIAPFWEQTLPNDQVACTEYFKKLEKFNFELSKVKIKFLNDILSFDLTSPNSEEEVKYTPLNVAVHKGLITLVELLLQNGANINASSTNLDHPLFICSQAGNAELVDLLLKKGANVNQTNKLGSTALVTASQRGHFNIVQLLVKAGADVNKENKAHYTPLYVSAQFGHLDTVQFLLENKAEVNKPNEDGKTPLFSAAEEGNLEVVKLLLKNGADATKATNDGELPEKVASDKGHTDIVNLLKDKAENMEDS